MTTRLEAIATGVIVMSAVAVAFADLHREVTGGAKPSATAYGPPVAIKDYKKAWAAVLQVGTPMGDTSAPVKIVEFADLECPGCRAFYERVRQLPESLQSQMALVFVHYPLPMHRFALGAARATECARGEHKFAAMVDALFSKQDSLGLKTWVSYSVDAGLRDTAAFARCVSSSAAMSLVEAGRSLGRKMDVNGTPTVIVNGWRFQSPPYDSLAAVVGRFAAAARRRRELAEPENKTNGSPQ